MYQIFLRKLESHEVFSNLKECQPSEYAFEIWRRKDYEVLEPC